MVSLQPRLSLKVAQKQILTPGLVQMVSVLALNKLELRDMIQAEMVENPVLEELEEPLPVMDEVARREEERAISTDQPEVAKEKNDAFEEIDFGSFFRDYLDPGYRSPETESIERPSFENFLSRPSTLTDHLTWQLGAMVLRAEVREAAELVIGNLDEDGYLTASDDELIVATLGVPEANGAAEVAPDPGTVMSAEVPDAPSAPPLQCGETVQIMSARADLKDAIEIVRQLDPVGVGARDLRECLLAQLKYHQGIHERQNAKGGPNGTTDEVLRDAGAIIDQYLKLVQNKQVKELAKAMGRSLDAVQAALDFIRTLDPRPGARYNLTEPKLIEPDVAFIKQGDDYVVVLNDDDVPQLRLNPTYRRLLQQDSQGKDVRNYVKEKYKSAIQLIKNIEQRKQTILKVCYAIIGRQRDFLDRGIDQLKPMMIKEVAEEIGVHPSTVSRAVANKYAHTAQGVFELRYFFSESVQGPEGGGTSLLILKRRVKKLIEEEDTARPYTDEQITRILQSQGIQVTRRTVAKYREDMRIPSTHQRRVKK